MPATQFAFLVMCLLATAINVSHAADEPKAQVSMPPSRPPVPKLLIFDTDMGNDIDDALALGLIHSFIGRDECRLLAVTVSKDNPLAARYCDIVNCFYAGTGPKGYPVGRVRGGKTPEDGTFLPAVTNSKLKPEGRPKYFTTIKKDEDVPDAVTLLRKTLAPMPDKSVTLVVVGFSTNIARLLDSKPDEISPLDGRALVEQKVALLSMMAGYFGTGQPKDFKEYNVHIDLDAATKVFAEWPTPIVSSGFEIGLAIEYPATSIERDFNYVPFHPLKEGYKAYLKMPYDRPTWDLTSVLYAVRSDRGYFGLSEPGEISVVDGGVTVFKPGGHGRHRHLTLTPEQAIRAKEAFVLLASEAPRMRSTVYQFNTN